MAPKTPSERRPGPGHGPPDSDRGPKRGLNPRAPVPAIVVREPGPLDSDFVAFSDSIHTQSSRRHDMNKSGSMTFFLVVGLIVGLALILGPWFVQELPYLSKVVLVAFGAC